MPKCSLHSKMDTFCFLSEDLLISKSEEFGNKLVTVRILSAKQYKKGRSGDYTVKIKQAKKKKPTTPNQMMLKNTHTESTRDLLQGAS